MKVSDANAPASGIRVIPIQGLPLIEPGDDVAGLLAGILTMADLALKDNDVLVVSHKIVSKAEGRLIEINRIQPLGEAKRLAQELDMDPRRVQLILDESKRIVRRRKGLIIAQHKKGWICANAGVDFSNAPGNCFVCLPEDPDRSARLIRQTLEQSFPARIGVIISDSQGRPFRNGITGVALGVSGMPALVDRSGAKDLFGYGLQNTQVAMADLIVSAALLVMGESDEGVPAALVRGLGLEARDGDGRELIRPDELDMFQ